MGCFHFVFYLKIKKKKGFPLNPLLILIIQGTSKAITPVLTLHLLSEFYISSSQTLGRALNEKNNNRVSH